MASPEKRPTRMAIAQQTKRLLEVAGPDNEANSL
jgi:hypothetical protein